MVKAFLQQWQCARKCEYLQECLIKDPGFSFTELISCSGFREFEGQNKIFAEYLKKSISLESVIVNTNKRIRFLVSA